MKQILLFNVLFTLFLSPLFSSSQSIKEIEYEIINRTKSGIPDMGQVLIQAASYQLFELDIESLKNDLEGVSYREGELNGFIAKVELPHIDGTTRTYTVKRNQTLHPDLNMHFPEIKTYDAYATDGSGTFVKWDITPTGLHAMIMIPGGSTIFIDPYIQGNTKYYIVYRKKDFITSKHMECSIVGIMDELEEPKNSSVKAMNGTCELRTYRLALSATGEYTTFHGGTVALALAAQVTTMNRVNGVYEKDIAISMVIIPNNDLIVYTNSASDPFANGNPGTMIGQNQTNTDNIIGSANYDIGHVFGTNSGGLAGLGVVCTGGQKARGVTGSSAPVGDPFDIDYVAHEMGHQFGANHTQNNSCNSVSAARFEPGSASTIMGYAGICAPNVQNNSDDYFHGYSLSEIGSEILSVGHQCEELTALNNDAPTVNSTNGNISVPISTPFALTASATDPDGDILTYLWEQMNNQASTQPPVSTSIGGPNFRSWDPSLDSTRFFPNLQALANNGPFTWEVLPSVSRTMNFRVTVKDNHAVGSCNDYVNVTVSTVATAGPFVVSYPSATGITWGANETQTVTWSVANTDLTPINCAIVRILLSTDGGLTYPYELNAGTANDGTEAITVPNVSTTTARVMVISSAGTFFDISNNNFVITDCAQPTVPTVSLVQGECSGDESVMTITSGDLNDAQQWQWFTGSCNGTSIGTGLSIAVSPTISTSYYVMGTGVCPGLTCANVLISIPTINTNVNQNGVQLTAVQTGVTYQWIDCLDGNSFVNGETSQSFTPTQEVGSYAVILNADACPDTSDCFFIDQTGLEENENIIVSLQPNPFSDYITIIWFGSTMNRLELRDVSGKLIFNQSVNNLTEVTLKTTELSSGIYYVRLIGEQGTAVEQLLKK